MTVHRQPRVVVGPGWKFANWLHSSPSRNDKYCCHIDQMTKQDCLTQQEATWPHKSTASELYIALNQRYESCLFWNEQGWRESGVLHDNKCLFEAFVPRILIISHHVLRQQKKKDELQSRSWSICGVKSFTRYVINENDSCADLKKKKKKKKAWGRMTNGREALLSFHLLVVWSGELAATIRAASAGWY